MTTLRTLLAGLVLCFAMGAAAAEDSRVSVVFAYSDPKVTCVSRDAHARALMDEIARFLQTAGDIEIWRGPGRCDLRVMRDIYPPRLNDLTHAAPVTADGLRDEKALLLDWLRTELREAGS